MKTLGYLKDEFHIKLTMDELFDILLSLEYDFNSEGIDSTPNRKERVRLLYNRLHDKLDLGTDSLT